MSLEGFPSSSPGQEAGTGESGSEGVQAERQFDTLDDLYATLKEGGKEKGIVESLRSKVARVLAEAPDEVSADDLKVLKAKIIGVTKGRIPKSLAERGLKKLLEDEVRAQLNQLPKKAVAKPEASAEADPAGKYLSSPEIVDEVPVDDEAPLVEAGAEAKDGEKIPVAELVETPAGDDEVLDAELVKDKDDLARARAEYDAILAETEGKDEDKPDEAEPPAPEQAAGGPKIEKPKDDEEELLRDLVAKLGEYRRRLAGDEKRRAEYSKENPYKSPQETFSIIAETRYKLAVLESVLDNGSVDTHALARELEKQDGVFIAEKFQKACVVIDAYCKGQADQVGGGTGFGVKAVEALKKSEQGAIPESQPDRAGRLIDALNREIPPEEDEVGEAIAPEQEKEKSDAEKAVELQKEKEGKLKEEIDGAEDFDEVMNILGNYDSVVISSSGVEYSGAVLKAEVKLVRDRAEEYLKAAADSGLYTANQLYLLFESQNNTPRSVGLRGKLNEIFEQKIKALEARGGTALDKRRSEKARAREAEAAARVPFEDPTPSMDNGDELNKKSAKPAPKERDYLVPPPVRRRPRTFKEEIKQEGERGAKKATPKPPVVNGGKKRADKANESPNKPGNANVPSGRKVPNRRP
ncbi:hypothetical protein KW786_02165 [Candidatus Parcubacteria bacterium]|nr:hypothetical protein [Candidatus Parcubacteria bacterium]